MNANHKAPVKFQFHSILINMDTLEPMNWMDVFTKLIPNVDILDAMKNKDAYAVLEAIKKTDAKYELKMLCDEPDCDCSEPYVKAIQDIIKILHDVVIKPNNKHKRECDRTMYTVALMNHPIVVRGKTIYTEHVVLALLKLSKGELPVDEY